MHVVIEHEGRLHTVEVTPGPQGTFVVVVDGQTTEVDVRRLGDGTFSLRLPDGSMHSIGVERVAHGDERVVSVNGHRVVTTRNGRRSRRSDAQAGATGQQRISAPMPGKIVRVLTAVGENVDARQPLVVVEAMKMENELSVSRPGRVVDILIAEGQSVEAGRLLVVVE